MSRQPQQVHIWLYRENGRAEWEFAVFQRSDNPDCWQGVCGGLEEGETLEEGARRELFEEAGIAGPRPLYRLDSVSYVPACVFDKRAQEAWGQDVVVVPMAFFAMPCDGDITLSSEHTEIVWLPYEEAERRVMFHAQKTALYELCERLRRGNLIRP